MTETIAVTEHRRELAFGFEDMNRYHGGGSPAGVATAFKVLQRAFAVLSPDRPPDRRSVVIRTAFRGPGARDGFEAVTRAVSDDRFAVDRTLVRPDLGRLREDFVFDREYRQRVGHAWHCGTVSSPRSSSTWPAARTEPPTRSPAWTC